MAMHSSGECGSEICLEVPMFLRLRKACPISIQLQLGMENSKTEHKLLSLSHESLTIHEPTEGFFIH